VPKGLRDLPAKTAYTSALTISERTRAAVARKIQTLLIDDLDGSTAEGSVRFGLDGTEYEVDLNAGHARELRVCWPGTSMLPAGPAAVHAGQAAVGGLDTTEVRECGWWTSTRRAPRSPRPR
jgi:hypothetical protein